MSGRERERLVVIAQVCGKVLGQGAAADRLGICVRQVKRLVRAYRAEGDAGLVSRQRGRASNRRLAPGVGARASELLGGKYHDFGPTLACEKLAELDGIVVSRETIRRLQIGLGLWKPKRRRHKRVFQLRERRPRFGELIQIDGSPHDWFEGRGPRCTLIVFIDDATGRLTALRFAPVETTRAYLGALRDHVLYKFLLDLTDGGAGRFLVMRRRVDRRRWPEGIFPWRAEGRQGRFGGASFRSTTFPDGA